MSYKQKLKPCVIAILLLAAGLASASTVLAQGEREKIDEIDEKRAAAFPAGRAIAASSGDMAYGFSRRTFAFDADKSRREEKGKGVVARNKVNVSAINAYGTN